MINLNEDLKIFIYNANVDMRKSINGLTLIVLEEMKLDPQDKILYLFANKAKDKFKAILWEGDGFLLIYKRLEQSKFKFPKNIDGNYYEIDADLFAWLRKGFDFYSLKFSPELKKSKYF